MAEKTRERLKRTALLGFVTVSILLVALTWMDGLNGDAPPTPSYYRDTFQIDENIYLTVTAEFLQFQEDLAAGTPAAPEAHDGSGGGRGQGGGQEHEADATPTPGG